MAVIDVRMEEIKQNIRKWLRVSVPVGIAVVVLIIAANSFGTVGAGERGVMLQFGAVQGDVIEEGLYFKIPLVQNVELIDVRIQKNEVTSTASSKDLQIVTSKIALNYHLDPDNVNNVWQEVGKNYNSRIIAPSIQEAVKSVTARFTAEELITKREEVKDQIKANLFERLSENFIIVDEFNIIDFSFSAAFNEAIEAKVTAEQLKLKADRDLERIRIEAEQNAVAAEGKAKAILTEAQALRANPQVVELRWIEKWDGKTPLYWGEVTPFVGLN
jgi:prohibitin 2